MVASMSILLLQTAFTVLVHLAWMASRIGLILCEIFYIKGMKFICVGGFVVVELNQFLLMYVVKVVRLRTVGKCCHDRPGLTRNVGPAGNLSLVLKWILSADRRLAKGWDWRRHRPGLTRNAGPVCALSLVEKRLAGGSRCPAFRSLLLPPIVVGGGPMKHTAVQQ